MFCSDPSVTGKHKNPGCLNVIEPVQIGVGNLETSTLSMLYPYVVTLLRVTAMSEIV